MALDTRGLASGFGQGFGLADQYYARQNQQELQGKANGRADRSMEMREEQFGMQKDQAEQQKARQSAEFTLGKIAQGVDLSDDEMKFMKENPQYWGALDPEMDSAIENAQRVIDPSDPMDSNDPEALYSMNLMFGHRINRGEGGKKRIAGLYPGQQEGTVAFDLEVEGEDGKKYNAPMTKNRGVEDDDEVMQTPVESLINQVQGYRMLRNAFRGPEAQQNASRVLAALRGDKAGAPTKGINMNGFLVDPVTGEQMGDFRTDEQRNGGGVGSGGGGGPSFGKIQPGDFTPESLQKYGQTNDLSDLARYESKRVVNIGGVTHMMDPVNGTMTPGQITESGFQATGSPISTGQNTTTVTAGLVGANESQIAGMKETAKFDAQLATKPAVEGAVAAAKATAQNQVKSMSPEAQSAERMKITSAQSVIAQIDNLTTSNGYMDALTGVRGKLPPIPGTPGFDAEVAFNQLRDSLTLENLDKMSGVLTDRDIQLLSSAASGLEFGMSRKALEARISIIKSVLEDQSTVAQDKLKGMTGGSSSPGGDAGIMGMSADQIQSLNPADLSDQELKQAADRYNQLGGQ